MGRIELFLLLAVLTAGPAVGSSVPDGASAAATDILALSPEMEQFLDQRIRPGLVRGARARGLMDALFGKDGLDIVYGRHETKTAIETFESGSGNCLSFTLLFVALARHLGLSPYFQEVGEILSWDRGGDVAVSNRHMFAEIATTDGLIRVDFLPGVEKRYRSVRRVDEKRVRAHYYSNLGAEALMANEFERALELFDRAVQEDSTLATAWVNMGVAHRRMGQDESAEACYLRALEFDPNEVTAASNLVGLYQSTGRKRLAGPYLRRVEKHRRSNPFWQFQMGLEASVQGRLRSATRHLKTAVRLLPEDPLFRTELGKVQARAGRMRRAERSYGKALRLNPDEEQRRVLEELLRHLHQDPA